MKQMFRAGALGRPRGIGWGGRQEVGLGWGTHVNPWLLHVNVWQKPLQYCKVISLQRIKINGKKLRPQPPKIREFFFFSTLHVYQHVAHLRACRRCSYILFNSESLLSYTYNQRIRNYVHITQCSIFKFPTSITMHTYSLEFLPILKISNSLK